MRILICYVPVLHAGYRRFFERHKDVECCYIFDESVIGRFEELKRDLRMLAPSDIRLAVKSWNIFPQVKMLDVPALQEIRLSKAVVVMPGDELSRKFATEFLRELDVNYDDVFLRYDRKTIESLSKVNPDQVVSTDEADRSFMREAQSRAELSSDWWRRIGAVLQVQGGFVYYGYNQHLPNEHQPYFDGDTRVFFNAGEQLELSTAIHAEKVALARAVNQGHPIKGSRLFVTTFPCPPCAKDLAAFQIGELYFAEGYSRLDGEQIMRDAGVKLIRVDMGSPRNA